MPTLLAFIEDDIGDGLDAEIQRGIAELAASGAWSSAPTFVNEVEPATAAGDEDIVTLGAFVELAPNGSPGEHESLQDAERFVAWWSELSARRHTTVGFELDGDAVGWIDDGDASDLENGLLRPWQQQLSSRND